MNIKRVLYPTSNTISLTDIPTALVNMGYEVIYTNTPVSFQNFDATEATSLLHEIKELDVDIAISHNFSPSLAEACNELGLRYISWVFDAPLESLYAHSALHSTNYIFCFDRKMISQLENINLPHIYHFPLAANTNKVASLEISSHDEERFSTDISLVGKLYEYNVLDRFKEYFSEALLININDWFNRLFGQWNSSIDIHDALSQESLNELTALFGKNKSSCGMPDKDFFESALIRGLSYRERVFMLNKLSERHIVSLYTGSDTTNLVNVNINGPTDYSTETPKIFHLSKINLNLTMRSIESGIPQRIFDIMSVGGFVLTNYQPELEEYFDVGKEIVCFHNFDEMEHLVDYYLAHDKERMEIAINGYKRVLSDYNYEIALTKILKIVESNFD